MNPINRKTYYIDENGWFTSSLKPVTKEAFKKHQAEERAAPSSLNRAIRALAMGILAVTQSMRIPMSGSAPGAQIALPLLSLHLCSHIPIGSAQAATLLSTATTAPLATQGDEFQVNTYTTDIQGNPSVAALAGGGFVVNWESWDQDGKGRSGVYGQRFDRVGAKVGSEFLINTYTTDNQLDPSVAALAGGGFVVTWRSDDQDGSFSGVYGQRFDGVGAKVESEFPINTYTTDRQENPSVAPLVGGGFVVTWSSNGQDGSNYGIYGQRFNGEGAKVGSEFPINTYTTAAQSYPSVEALAGGGFVVAWQSWDQDGSIHGVYGQRFDEAGAKVGSEFPINTYTANSQRNPSVAALGGGGFVVAWQSDGQDGSGYGIYGQRFNGVGAKVGTEFPINTYTQDHQWNPSVAPLTGEGFVVTWQSEGQDGSLSSVYGQRFNGAGAKVGIEFSINTYSKSYQESPSVAALPGEGFVVTWQSLNQDGSHYGVYGRLFPGNSVSTSKPMTPSKSRPGLTANTSETGTVHVESSAHATTQTPLIAGVAAGVAALAYSLLAGGLFYFRRKKEADEPSRAVQLEKGNFIPSSDTDHSGSSGEYQMLPGAQSHYKKWPKEAPVNDASHYHPDIEVLNQKMAQEYGDVSSPQQQGDYDIIATSHYRDLPQEDPSNDTSHYHPDIEVLNQEMAKEYEDVSSPKQQGDYDIIATAHYRDLPQDASEEMVSARV